MYWFLEAWNAADTTGRMLLVTIALSSACMIVVPLYCLFAAIIRRYKQQQAREVILSMFERYSYGRGRPQGDDFKRLKNAYAFLIRTWIRRREAFAPFVMQDQVQRWLHSMDFEWKKGENPYTQ